MHDRCSGISSQFIPGTLSHTEPFLLARSGQCHELAAEINFRFCKAVISSIFAVANSNFISNEPQKKELVMKDRIHK